MIEALLNYQEADAKLRKVEVTLAGSEERKKTLSAKKYIEGVEETLKKLDEKAAELYGAYNGCVSEIAKLKEQGTEFSGAASDATDKSALDYLSKKTDEILLKIKSLSDTVNRINGEIQTLLKEYAQTRAKTKAAKEQYEQNLPKYAELKNSLKPEKEKAEKELGELKKKVDPALMERYLKKRASFYPVAYEVKGDVCGACNMQLSMSEIGKLKNGEVIECEHCGRLLYSK